MISTTEFLGTGGSHGPIKPTPDNYGDKLHIKLEG